MGKSRRRDENKIEIYLTLNRREMVDPTQASQDRLHCRAFANTAMNLMVP